MRKSRPVEFLVTAGYLGGGSVLFAIILFFIAAWEHLEGRSSPANILCGLGVVFFCFGAYWAWNKERDKFEAERLKHEQPDFKLDLFDVLSSYNANMDMTTICISATLLNRGAASAATGWVARFQSPTIDITIGYRNLPSEEFEWPLSNGQILVLKRRDMLPARTMLSVEKGSCAHGRMLFEFQGDRRNDLSSGTGCIWIGCNDLTGRLTQQVFRGYDIPGGNFFPDEETRWPEPLHPDFPLMSASFIPPE